MVDEVLAKVTLPHTSGLPRDNANQDFSFLAANTADATLDGIAASIVSFYNTDNGAGEAIAFYIGTQISRAASAARIDFYAIPDAALDGIGAVGSPVHTVPFTLGASGGSNGLPDEVAVKITVLADGWDTVSETQANPAPPPATIRPRSRYRGGFYLGPLDSNAKSTTAFVSPRPSTELIADLDAAIFRFMDERGGDFAVWSRADAVFRLVAPDGNIWVDNAFDTIRKRGVAPTTRTVLFP